MDASEIHKFSTVMVMVRVMVMVMVLVMVLVNILMDENSWGRRGTVDYEKLFGKSI